MSAILIKFGDNDFGMTWREVLTSAVRNPNFFKIKDKNKLAFILSNAAFGMYVLHQNNCEYNGLEKYDEEYIRHMKTYLSIVPSRIKLDAEVDKYLTKTDWDNSETFYVYDYDNEVHSI